MLNLVILAIFTGIVLVVRSSFVDIQSSLTTIIHRDVNQVIRNAQSGRELTRAFAQMQVVVDKYTSGETQAKEAGEQLIITITRLGTQTKDERLQNVLNEFAQQLRMLLDRATGISEVMQTAVKLDEEFVVVLKALEEIISENLITAMLDGEDVALLEQISMLMPGYRETVLQVAIEFSKMRKQHAAMRAAHNSLNSDEVSAEEHHPEIFALLDDLSMRFETLKLTTPEIEEYGAKLEEIVAQYKELVRTFHQKLIQFNTQFDEVTRTQDQVLTVMNDIDKEVAQTAGHIEQDMAKVIGASKQTIFMLWGGGFLALIITWLSMRWMTKPLAHLSVCADKLANGDIECHIVESNSNDEIGTLSRAFRKLIVYFQEMAHSVTEISRGNLEMEVTPRSAKDVLGEGFHQMNLYLKDMGQFASHVAQGDLRAYITLHSDTDQLGNAFISMKEGLIALISEIRSGADHIASISAQVLSTSTQNADALGHIGNAAEVTSSAMREVSSSAEEVRMNTEHLSSSVEQTSASISQVISSIKHVAENSRKLSSFADETKLTMGSIVTSLETVADQAEDSRQMAETTTQDAVSGQQSVEQMITRIIAISDVTQNISEIVSRLEDRSKEIGTILDVINEVADQTSLLALNASIIAAQAGVHGRGFAVVADEIKELATRVGTSTKEIARIIKSVQRDSSDAVAVLDQGRHEVEQGVAVAHKAGEALQKIGQSAENSSEVAAQIAVSVRDQTTASQQIAESIQDVANMINEITRATQEQEKNSSQLFGVVEKMQSLAAQVMRATQEQQQSTLHVTEFMEDVITLVNQNTPTVNQLAQSANELNAQADALTDQVERFVLPARSTHSIEKAS